jgi:hypothetical protein
MRCLGINQRVAGRAFDVRSQPVRGLHAASGDRSFTLGPSRREAKTMKTQSPTFIVRLQPQPGSDPIKALRWILKTSLRQFGMRCIAIDEEPPAALARRSSGNR